MSTPEENPAEEAGDTRLEADYEECGACGHYPAYCPPGGKSCSAWDPDRPDHKCACKGRKPPKPTPQPIQENP